jgi:hypothetical protein
MLKTHTKSARRWTLGIAAALMAPLATLGLAAPAMAAPKGEFAQFAQCPLSVSNLTQCILAKTFSGEFTIGTTTVPINKTITLQGGDILNESTGTFSFVGAANGETLSKTPLNVPGGLLGIIAPSGWPKWLQELFNEFINNGITGVTATNELAKPASSIGINPFALLEGSGTALQLPLKVKLGNAFLGNNCYIGSSSNPVIVNLTSGTTNPPKPNKPISGKVGELEFKAGGEILIDKNNSLVDNAFAAPGAEGCGGIFSFLIDPAVNAKLGLPSAAGHNTAILNGTLEAAGAQAARESE